MVDVALGSALLQSTPCASCLWPRALALLQSTLAERSLLTSSAARVLGHALLQSTQAARGAARLRPCFGIEVRVTVRVKRRRTD